MNSKTIDLKIELLRRSLCQRAIARALGISPQYLCDIFKGRKAAPEYRRRLVEEFGLPKRLVNVHPRRDSDGGRRIAA